MNKSDIKDLNDIDFIQESFDENCKYSNFKQEIIEWLILLVQHELLKIRYRWTQADSENDYELNFDEFLAFRHPELAGQSYRYIVDDIISHMGLFVFFPFSSEFFFF